MDPGLRRDDKKERMMKKLWIVISALLFLTANFSDTHAKPTTLNLQKQYETYRTLTKSLSEAAGGSTDAKLVDEVVKLLKQNGYELPLYHSRNPKIACLDIVAIRMLHPDNMAINKNLAPNRLNVILDKDYNVAELKCE